MRLLVNKGIIEGYIFDIKLDQKQSKKKEYYLAGSIYVSPKEDLSNIVEVSVNYVAAKTKSGNESKTYNFLQKVMNEGLTVKANGIENAAKISFPEASLTCEEYFKLTKDEDGKEEFSRRSFVKLKSGFKIFEAETFNENEILRNLYAVDTIIKDIRRVDGDEQNPTRLIIYAFVGTYERGEEGKDQLILQPFEFLVEDLNGINYFSSLGINPDNPVFTQLTVWVRNTRTVEEIPTVAPATAFGQPIVIPVKPKEHVSTDYMVLNCLEHPYKWDETGMTKEELQELLLYREKRNVAKKENSEKRLAEKRSQENQPLNTNGFTEMPIGDLSSEITAFNAAELDL